MLHSQLACRTVSQVLVRCANLRTVLSDLWDQGGPDFKRRDWLLDWQSVPVTGNLLWWLKKGKKGLKKDYSSGELFTTP